MDLLFVAFLITGTGLVVWMRQPESRWHALCAAFSFACAFWPIALYFIGLSTSVSEATFWTRMTFLGPSIAAVLYLVIVRSFGDTMARRGTPWIIGAAILIGSLVLAGALLHPEVIREVVPTPAGPRFGYGWLYPFEMLAASLLVALVGIEHVAAYRSLTGRKRAQALIMFVGTIVTALLTSIPSIILPLAGFSDAYRFGPYPFFVGLASTYYAMIEQRLFDVEVGLGRIFKLPRYRRHLRVRETLESAENYLSLGSLSKSLQEAFGSSEMALAVLDPSGRPQESFGDTALALPSDSLVHYRNGAVVMRSDVPGNLQAEMRDKGLSTIVRLGEPGKPSALMLFGGAFEEILFARQDVELLCRLSERLNLIVQVASAYKSSIDKSIERREGGAKPGGRRPAGIALQAVGFVRLTVLDQSGSYGAWLKGLPIERMDVTVRNTPGEFLLALRWPCDLAVVISGETTRDLRMVLNDFDRLETGTPIVVLCPESSSVSCGKLEGRYYMGWHRFTEDGREDAARFLLAAVAAGRYLRGELDLQALAASTGRGDFTGITRAIQKKMIETALRQTQTKAEAARRLGISSANLSLKLRYFGFRQADRAQPGPPKG